MSMRSAHPALAAALILSRQVVAAADQGELTTLAQLDAERRQLLQSFRSAHGARCMAEDDQILLQEISELNERALGLMEHRRRMAARAVDTAAVGRRAVNAYASNRAPR